MPGLLAWLGQLAPSPRSACTLEGLSQSHTTHSPAAASVPAPQGHAPLPTQPPPLQTRQKLHLGSKEFRPTPNVRNQYMLQEAEEFSAYLYAFEASLRTYERAVIGEGQLV
jgi:hypothetical protein